MTQDTSGFSQTEKSNSHKFENTKNTKGEENGNFNARRKRETGENYKRITFKIAKRNDSKGDQLKDQDRRSESGERLNQEGIKASSKGRSYNGKNKARRSSDQGLFHQGQEVRRFLTVKEIARFYSVSLWSIYEAIKTDPSFPFIDIGPKRNYRIDAEKFQEWLIERTNKKKSAISKIPTLEEITNAKL